MKKYILYFSLLFVLVFVVPFDVFGKPYKSQKPFVRDSDNVIETFLVFSDLSETDKIQYEKEFEEWKKACDEFGKKNHVVKTGYEKRDYNGEEYVCVAEQCESDEYEINELFSRCEKKESGISDVNYMGVVKDTNGEMLPGANIVVLNNNNSGCITNFDGVFGESDTCKLSDNKVQISYVGYKTITATLQPDGNEFVLEQDSQIIDEIDVTAKKNIKGCSKSGGEVKFDENGESYCECPINKSFNSESFECENNTPQSDQQLPNESDNNVVSPIQEDENNGNNNQNNSQSGTSSGNNAQQNTQTSNKKQQANTRTDAEKKKALADKKKSYDDAKANEQLLANRTLTAATTAATGIGGMQLAMGLSEQKADKAAEQDMAAYIQTFRCTYGGGKSVKGGTDEIELPGGNIPELMKLRNEYTALAASLKERKESLGMKPGIESEEILDKTTMSLYDDENVGITGGAYGSLYRAQALGSEEDQAKLDADKKEAKNRVIAGGVLVGTGIVGGAVGNSLINGKLGELIKQKKADKNAGAATKKIIKKEEDALKSIQKCLKDAGVKDTDNLSFSTFTATALNMKNVNCKKDLTNVKDKFANELFNDTDDEEKVFDQLVESFGGVVAGKMVGVTVSEPITTDQRTKAEERIKKSIDDMKESLEKAAKEDERTTSSNSSSTDGSLLDGASGALSGITGKLMGGGDGESGGALSGLADKAKGLLGSGGDSDGEGGGSLLDKAKGALGGGGIGGLLGG